MKKIIFSEEELKEIINSYTNNHESMAKIGQKYNVSKNVIKRVLIENNVEIKKDNHKYYADYRKFEKIDNPEKAYWLGFIAADGCNYWREKNASLIISIHQKDKDHLEKFKIFMNSNVEIKDFIQDGGFSNNTPMCKITFNSKELSSDLSNLGIIPRKSLVLEPPKIEKKYFLPFILGYFDGDGSIFQTKQNEFGISIEGTKELLTWINDILKISDKLEKRKEDDKNNFYIRCGGTQKPYNILKQLYESTECHLERKYEIYKILNTVVLNRNIE